MTDCAIATTIIIERRGKRYRSYIAGEDQRDLGDGQSVNEAFGALMLQCSDRFGIEVEIKEDD